MEPRRRAADNRATRRNMEQFGLALILFAAFWVGCGAGYLAMRLRAQVGYEKGRNESAAEIAALQEKGKASLEQMAEARRLHEGARAEVSRLEGEVRAEAERRMVAEARLSLLAQYESELNVRGQQAIEQQEEIKRLHAHIGQLAARLEEAKAAGGDRFEKWEALLEQTARSAHASGGGVPSSESGASLAPLQASLEQVGVRLEQWERERGEALAELRRHVADLAVNLKPRSGGEWAALSLDRVIEWTGVAPHCRQQELSEGLRVLAVGLPGERRIEVTAGWTAGDAVSLAADLRQRWNADAGEDAGLEFRVALLGGEIELSNLLTADPGLFEDAARNRLLLATPTTLLVLLRSVAWAWRQESAAVGAREFQERAGAIFARLRDLAGEIGEARHSLDRSRELVARAAGTLEDDLLPAVGRLTPASAEAPSPSLHGLVTATAPEDTLVPEAITVS